MGDESSKPGPEGEAQPPTIDQQLIGFALSRGLTETPKMKEIRESISGLTNQDELFEAVGSYQDLEMPMHDSLKGPEAEGRRIRSLMVESAMYYQAGLIEESIVSSQQALQYAEVMGLKEEIEFLRSLLG